VIHPPPYTPHPTYRLSYSPPSHHSTILLSPPLTPLHPTLTTSIHPPYPLLPTLPLPTSPPLHSLRIHSLSSSSNPPSHPPHPTLPSSSPTHYPSRPLPYHYPPPTFNYPGFPHVSPLPSTTPSNYTPPLPTSPNPNFLFPPFESMKLLRAARIQLSGRRTLPGFLVQDSSQRTRSGHHRRDYLPNVVLNARSTSSKRPFLHLICEIVRSPMMS